MTNMSYLRCSVLACTFSILFQSLYAVTTPRIHHNTTTGRIFIAHSDKVTISVIWDQTVQDIVASLAVGPTYASGGYAMMHTAMYEAWCYFETNNSESTEGDEQKAAMSFAAFQVLSTTFPRKKDDAARRFEQLLTKLCLSAKSVSTARSVGTRAARRVLDRYNRYVTSVGEFPFRSSCEQWRAEHVPIDNHEAPVQKFLTPDWGRRYTFGVPNGGFDRPPPPESILLVDGELNVKNATIYLDDGRTVPVNRSIVGTIINPKFIKQAEDVVRSSNQLNDRLKFIAEFWESGKGTSYPAGMWMTFGQWVSVRDSHNDAEDVRMFLALSNAIYDAGVLTWNTKKYYNYARPVRVIRDLGALGLIGRFDKTSNAQIIDAYDVNALKSHAISTEKFETYQRRDTGASPPFPEYTSGHSSFSAAGAEVLKRWTGSDRFEAQVTLQVGKSRFEPGRTPSEPVTLHWKSFSDAAFEAGFSRIAGGIHFEAGNVFGIILGRTAGNHAFKEVERNVPASNGMER